jgi:hypothetical protein
MVNAAPPGVRTFTTRVYPWGTPAQIIEGAPTVMMMVTGFELLHLLSDMVWEPA